MDKPINTPNEAPREEPQRTKEEWEAIIAEAQARKAQLEPQPSIEGVSAPSPQTPPPQAASTSIPPGPMVPPPPSKPIPPILESVVPPTPAVEVPKVEKTPKAKETVKDPSKAFDASSMVFTDIGTDEEFEATFRALEAADTRPEEIKDEDPREELINLTLCQSLGLRNKQHTLLTKILKALEENTEESSKLRTCIRELGLSKIRHNIPSSDGPKILSGDAALATVISRTKGVFRIPLYNSGFWVSVKPPTLSEIDGFIREVDIEFKEFGKILGAHYHLIFGIHIKQKLIDLLVANMINSNFDNFRNRTALVDAISLHDYDTIAWAFCSMMYADGINMGLYCTNPECGHRDTSQFIDLTRCNYLNHDVLNKDAVAWMMDGFNPKVVRTAKDLERYRNDILKANRTFKDEDGSNIYTLTVPSLDRYFSIGQELLERIVDLVHGETNINTEQLAGQITYNIYKMLTPWISKLTMADDGVAKFITSDSAAIMESLDIGYGENSKIYEEIEDFIGATRASYFGATSLKCPKCGKVPNFTKDNMFLFDMEQLFFGLSYLRLGRIGELI